MPIRDLLGDPRVRAVGVVLGCLVCQLGLGFGYAISPLAPDILAEFGWTRALYASAQGPQTLLIAITSPLIGVLVARHGARAVLSAGAVTLAAGYGMIAGMQAWWHLALAWAVIGLGVAGLGDIAVGAVVARWISRWRGLALGIVYTGSNLGGAIATRAVAALADRFSWRFALAVLAASGIVVLLPAAWFAVPDRAGAEAAADAEAEPASGSERDLDVRAALRTRSFWIIAIGLLGFWAYLYALLQHFVLALVDTGMARDLATAYWSNAVFMGMFSKIAFGWIADRVPAKTGLLLDYGLLALSSLFLLGVSGGGAATLWSFVVLFGFSYAARDVVTPLIIVHCFGSRNLAQIYGVLMLTILPGSAGSIFAGWVHDQTGAYQLAFLTLAGVNAATFALLFAVRDERVARPT
ncbi:MAG: MFS transporter [Deltaproteobacteria bacterium]|nr:MAG: MFS transporter [Deltaproteobacteria bacterium]